MKKFIILSIVLVSFINTKAQSIVLTVENGVLKVLSGTQGVTFNSDNSITFNGTATSTSLTQAQLDDLTEIRVDYTTEEFEPRMPCSSVTIILPTDGGNSVFGIADRLCGPSQTTYNQNGAKNVKCLDQNSYLCQAVLGNGWTFTTTDCI